MSSARPAPFLIADQPALDFLNTIAAPAGEQIEWIADGPDLVKWLEQSGAIGRSVAARYVSQADRSGALDRVAADARKLREWLRAFVRLHAGKPLRPEAVHELQPLNDLLARGEHYRQVEAVEKDDSRSLHLREERRWKKPEELLQPIAEAIGDLVCNSDFRYVRECEGPGCTLLFYDRSKGHARRWCSMAVCGNRAKAATHRARARSNRSDR